MATFEQLCATWSGGSAYVRLNLDQGSNDANGWNVNYSVQSRDTHGSVFGTWDWNKSGSIGGGGGSVGAATGLRTISSGSVYVGCDVNGNGSISASAFMDVAFGTGTASGGISLGRIALAPSISSLIADTITPVSARLGVELSSIGHGTSAAMYTQYRKQGTSTWTTQTAQNDVAGYNYFPISGLTPNTVYEYMAFSYNNNGDTVNTGIQTFTTLSGVKVILPDGTVQSRTVKSISPAGVVATRIVTKIT